MKGKFKVGDTVVFSKNTEDFDEGMRSTVLHSTNEFTYIQSLNEIYRVRTSSLKRSTHPVFEREPEPGDRVRIVDAGKLYPRDVDFALQHIGHPTELVRFAFGDTLQSGSSVITDIPGIVYYYDRKSKKAIIREDEFHAFYIVNLEGLIPVVKKTIISEDKDGRTETFNSIKEAAAAGYNELSLKAVLNGQLKTYRGKKWSRKIEILKEEN